MKQCFRHPLNLKDFEDFEFLSLGSNFPKFQSLNIFHIKTGSFFYKAKATCTFAKLLITQTNYFFWYFTEFGCDCCLNLSII